MTEHTWKLDTIVQVATCAKCGLVKLKTMNGEYVFAVRMDPQFCQCPSPYHREEEAKTE
jgi:hypothetical protein